ncbi:MAG: hypothetical protein R3C69_05100 [Geminicoccaceae bacterium]
MKARKTAKARWIERASVLLKTPNRSMNGSGEAIQSWKSDQASAVRKRSLPVGPSGLRAPVSAAATMS